MRPADMRPISLLGAAMRQLIALLSAMFLAGTALGFESSAGIGYGGLRDDSREAGSLAIFSLDTDPDDRGISLGLLTTGEGQKSTYYRLSTGPRITYRWNPQHSVHIALGTFSETRLVNSIREPSDEPIRCHGLRYQLGADYRMPLVTHNELVVGGFTALLTQSSDSDENINHSRMVTGVTLGLRFGNL